MVSLNEDKKQIGFFEYKWKDLKEKEARKILRELKETLVVPTVHHFFERKTNESKFVDWNLEDRKEYFGLIGKKIENKPKLRREGYLVFDLRDF